MKHISAVGFALLLLSAMPVPAQSFDAGSLAATCVTSSCAAQIVEATQGMSEREINEAMSSLAGELVALAKVDPENAVFLAMITAALQVAAAQATGPIAANIMAVAEQVAAGQVDAVNVSAIASVTPATAGLPASGPNASP